jgi:translocation and assembly module TamA
MMLVVVMVAVMAVALAVALHLPPVQRQVWDGAREAVEEATGLEVESDGFELRYLPARVSMRGVRITADGRMLARADRVRASWRWRSIVGSPRRLESIEIDGLALDLDAVPEAPPDEGGAQDPGEMLQAFEIARLRIRGASVDGSLPVAEVEVDGVQVTASLEDGRAGLELQAKRAGLTRDGRDLALGAVRVEASGGADGVRVDRFELAGGDLALRVAGGLETAPLQIRAEVEGAAELSDLAAWWDPNLASGLSPQGVAEIGGELAYDLESGLQLEVAHRGGELRVADLPIAEISGSLMAGEPSVVAAHPSWGRLRVVGLDDTTARLEATFADAPGHRALAVLWPEIAGIVGEPALVSGTLDATVTYPLDLQQLAADADLAMAWPDGRVAVEATGADGSWRVRRFEATAAGAVVEAAGELRGTTVQADLEVSVPRPAVLADGLAPWLPQLQMLGVDGGQLALQAALSGTIAAPAYSLDAAWSAPEILGRSLVAATLTASGNLDSADWETEVQPASGTVLRAAGRSRIADLRTVGGFRLTSTDLASLAAVEPGLGEIGLTGSLVSEGDFAYDAAGLVVSGTVDGAAIAANDFVIDRLGLRFAVDPEAAEVEDLELRALGGEVRGAARVDRTSDPQSLDAELTWSALDLAALPWEVPEAAAGVVAGRARLSGPLAGPDGAFELTWVSSEGSGMIDRLAIEAVLEDGVMEVMSREAETVVGSLVLSAEVPLASFGLPGGLWQEARSGPVRGSLKGRGLSTASVAEVLDLPPLEGVAETDLDVDLVWHPDRPTEPSVLIEATDLRLEFPTGEMKAEEPLVMTLVDGAFEIQPFVISGPESRLEIAATYAPTEDRVSARLRARIGEVLARWLPFDVRMTGALDVEADISGSADIASWSETARGRFRIDHPDGTIVWSDPPLEIRGLRVDGRLDRNGLTIDDGSVTVNRGRVELAGGWDPESEQGVVAEIDGVTLFTEGVLTRWNGQLAIEPRARRLAHIVGDLTLVAGVWDETFSITETFFGPVETTDVDDPLQDVSLELTVRDRSGVRVNNNLGDFDATWDVLFVGGTAAAPILQGEVRIAAGGTISLGGNQMTVRRGSLEFTGDPELDPIVEIVPMTETTFFGGDGEEQLDATVLATRSLAQGLTSALGFENQTLQPAEIATQIERDPSEQFMVGQRLTNNLAFFFGTNLTDVQDRTTMLQAWNIEGLRGFVLQAYQETIDDNTGVNAFQRFQWGGTAVDDDRPTIRGLRLEGEWPISKRQLKKATRLRRGQPFDPFLLFVASVRLERALAEAGYQLARVSAEQQGSDSSPKLVFTADAGPRQPVEFTGVSLPARTRRAVTALYRPPPLEQTAFDNMRTEIERHLDGRGFPEAQITIASRDGSVVVGAVPGPRLRLEGPVVEGVPISVVARLRERLGEQQTLALAYDQPQRLAAAAERLLALEGWSDASVENVELRRLSDGVVQVVLEVETGPRAEVDEVVLVGSDPLGFVARDDFGIRPGMPADRSEIDLEVRRLRQSYLQAGYRDVSARSTLQRRNDGGWRAEISLQPGEVRRVREVRLEGSRGIRDRLLRRGITIEEGDLLTDAAIDRSASQIANFSPVERVEVRTIERGTSQADVEFDVIQKRRWTAYVGAGWSTERGAQASFGFRDDNLFGRGVSADLRANVDSTERRTLLIGSLPPAPGSRWTLISTVGWSAGDAPDEPDLLEQEELLASFEAQYALTQATSLGTYYRWTDTRTFEKEPDPFFPFDIRLKVGVLGLRSVTDRFDNLFDPSSGFGLTSDIGWSSDAVGSDLEYVSWLTNFSTAVTPRPDWTWLQTARVGIAEPLKGTNLDREARYFAGGQGSMRGFDRNSVGPTTLGIDFTLVPAGGGALFILNEELRIPVWGDIRAAIFADIGQVWESWGDADWDLSVGAGVGIRWSTPIGPLWADVAWPVANVGISSDKPKFYLGIGRPF